MPNPLYIEYCRYVQTLSCLMLYSFFTKMGHPDVKWSIVSSYSYTVDIHFCFLYPESSLYSMPDPQLLLLHFMLLPYRFRTSTIGRTVPYPPNFC